MTQAIRAYDLANSVGVNTHFAYTNTAYSNFNAVEGLLHASHIRHTRDGYYPWPAGHPQYAIHRQLKAIGVDTIAVVPWSNPIPTVAQLVQFAQLAGNIAAFEITNEPDDQNNPDWVAQVKALAPVVVAACKQLGIPALAPALVHPESYSQLGELADVWDANVHFYPEPRPPETPPYGPNGEYSLTWWQAESNVIVDAALGSWITETGYVDTTVPGVIACYLLRAICYAASVGTERTYIYQLVDTDGYGLVSGTYAVTPAYTAIRHLLECLADNGKTAATFTPGALNVKVPCDSLLTQKSNGDYVLILWDGVAYKAGLDISASVQVPVGYQVASYQVIAETGADPETLCPGATLVPIGNGVALVTIRETA